MSNVIKLVRDKYPAKFTRDFALRIRQDSECKFEVWTEGLSKQHCLDELQAMYHALGMGITMMEIEIAERFGADSIPGMEKDHGDQ